jgi:hypothetical protein
MACSGTALPFYWFNSTVIHCPQKTVTKVCSSLVIAYSLQLLEPVLFYTVTNVSIPSTAVLVQQRPKLNMIDESGTRTPLMTKPSFTL